MKKIVPYVHRVQYYETDKMGIVHHSIYIRWFEEARIDMLDQLGIGFDKIEARGIMSPILSVDCRYLQPVRFGEDVVISSELTEFNGIRCTIQYEIRGKDDGELRTKGNTCLAFLKSDGTILRMKKEHPDIYETLKNQIREEKTVTS